MKKVGRKAKYDTQQMTSLKIFYKIYHMIHIVELVFPCDSVQRVEKLHCLDTSDKRVYINISKTSTGLIVIGSSELRALITLHSSDQLDRTSQQSLMA